jgi:hypothetical protein
MPDRALDLGRIPQDTCPVCGQRALRSLAGSSAGVAGAGERVVVCGRCGSQFRHDPDTRLSCYIHVSRDHDEIAPRLIGKWLTRRQAFEACRPLRDRARGSQAPGAAASSSVFWLAVLGAAAVVAMTCACLSAILLGPSMAETRRQIAAANAAALAAAAGAALDAGAPLTETGVLTGEVAVATGEPAGLLETTPMAPEELETPAPAEAPTAEAVTPPESTIPTASPQPAEAFPELQPTPASPEFEAPPALAGTPTLPPTFTPAPSLTPSPTTASTAPVDPLNSPLPAATPTETATGPASASSTPSPTAPSLSPTATPTSGMVMTGAIVISTVMYQGDPNLNEGDEYVEIENRGNERVNMGFWTLRSVSTNAVFSFGNAVGMDPGNVCRIYTYVALPDQRCGIGSALTFLSTVPVWSNTGDVAELRDANGVLISRFVYGTPP